MLQTHDEFRRKYQGRPGNYPMPERQRDIRCRVGAVQTVVPWASGHHGASVRQAFHRSWMQALVMTRMASLCECFGVQSECEIAVSARLWS
jgi:hypothetical protein